jgi:hypothetical protein
MKKSAAVQLTIVAALGMVAHAQGRPDPCGTATFNEQACQAAIQNNGYCWNNRWVKLRYHYPFPYYFDAYLDFVSAGGVASSASVGACGPARASVTHSHVVTRAGFGSSGACHAAHS